MDNITVKQKITQRIEILKKELEHNTSWAAEHCSYKISEEITFLNELLNDIYAY